MKILAKKPEDNTTGAGVEAGAEGTEGEGVEVDLERKVDIQDIRTQEEMLARLGLSLSLDEKIDYHTDLTPEEIRLLAAIESMSSEFNLDFITNFCLKLKKLKVSQDRKGRTETKEIVGSAVSLGQLGMAQRIRAKFLGK